MFPAITTAVQSLINLILGEVGIVILVSGAVGLYILWYLRGRDKPVGLVAEYLREPPSDLHPGVVGTLIDEHANHHDVIATLVNLGERNLLPTLETPIRNIVPNLVYAATGREVTLVMVDGRILLRNGKLLTADEEAVRQEAQFQASALAQRVAADPVHEGMALLEPMAAGML